MSSSESISNSEQAGEGEFAYPKSLTPHARAIYEEGLKRGADVAISPTSIITVSSSSQATGSPKTDLEQDSQAKERASSEPLASSNQKPDSPSDNPEAGLLYDQFHPEQVEVIVYKGLKIIFRNI